VERLLKSRGAVQNVTGLLKACHATDAKRKRDLLQNELDMSNSSASILFYAISAAEKRLAMTDAKYVANHAKARQAQLKLLGEGMAMERQEYASYLKTSGVNRAQLKTMLAAAQKRFQSETKQYDELLIEIRNFSLKT
jgi:hypothetical protein